jgi:Sec-independent protein translocase protein TatA
MRQLGQGMSGVGLDDVLETASGKARELGQSLREVKTEMATKGNSFFEELKRTNPDELKAVFEQLKFDPKTMGIDEFVEKFREATK